MKKVLLTLTAAVALAACNKSNVATTTPEEPVYEARVDPTDIKMTSLNPEAVEYFKDLGVMAEWYSSHETALKAAVNYNNVHDEADTGYNELVHKFGNMNIQDDRGNSLSFFDMPDSLRQSFLRDFVKEEASALTEKLNDAGSTRTDDFLADQNAAVDHVFVANTFSDSLDFSDEAAHITAPNAYARVSNALRTEIEPAGNSALGAPGGQGISMDNYLKAIATIGIFNLATITYNPVCTNNPPSNFVNKMRDHIAKGRILVALPGGDDAIHPLVFNGLSYDVGHVAVISVDKNNVPSNAGDNTIISIGTNSEHGMHEEKLKEDWTGKHGMSYLMEPIRVTHKYVTKWIGKGIFSVPYPYWEKEVSGVNNNDTYNQILGKLGTPYCSLYEFLYAQKVAPSRFICSSSAWWAIKAAHDIDLNSWYNTTIFPAGVYLSGDMRVVAKTF